MTMHNLYRIDRLYIFNIYNSDVMLIFGICTIKGVLQYFQGGGGRLPFFTTKKRAGDRRKFFLYLSTSFHLPTNCFFFSNLIRFIYIYVYVLCILKGHPSKMCFDKYSTLILIIERRSKLYFFLM